MIPKKLTGLSFSELEAFVRSGLRESRTLDFKRDFVGPRDEDKREFLADVSAFANTAGGDLVFGIEEAGGEASAIPGIELGDPDAEISRLENILRTGLDPRLPGVELRWFPNGDGRGCLIVRSPRSFASPHRITFRDSGKFFGRNSTGKYPLDVGELRAAFLSADGLNQSIRRFRSERLGLIEAGEGAMPIRSVATLVLHLIPLSSFAATSDVMIDEDRLNLRPLGNASGASCRHTLEGMVKYVGSEEQPDSMLSYTLLFRNGIIEAVSAVGGTNNEYGPFIGISMIEWPLLSQYGNYINFLTQLGLESPFYIFLSLLNVRGHCLRSGRLDLAGGVKLRRDTVILSEIVVNDIGLTAESVLRPTFDLIWNAFGYAKSFSFDNNGAYVGARF